MAREVSWKYLQQCGMGSSCWSSTVEDENTAHMARGKLERLGIWFKGACLGNITREANVGGVEMVIDLCLYYEPGFLLFIPCAAMIGL
jgi:hypothetical protein